jgi:uncharacterized protein YggE
MSQRLQVLLCTTLVLLGAVRSGAQASMQGDTGRTHVMASSTARQTVTPDRATLMFWIDAQGMSIEEASSRLATMKHAVLDTLRRLNLGAGAVQTYDNGVTPYRSTNMSSAMMNGPSFTGRLALRVELPRADHVAPVSAAALAKGATFVAPPTFTVSTLDSVRYVLIPRAFEQALRDAEVLAHAAGGHLGRLVDVSAPQMPMIGEQSALYVNGFVYDNGPRMLPNTTVSASVTARWLFVPGAR